MDRRVLWRSSWALWRIKRVHVEISADVPLQQAGKDLGGSRGDGSAILTKCEVQRQSKVEPAYTEEGSGFSRTSRLSVY
jgi:hypothetical protein